MQTDMNTIARQIALEAFCRGFPTEWLKRHELQWSRFCESPRKPGEVLHLIVKEKEVVLGNEANSGG